MNIRHAIIAVCAADSGRVFAAACADARARRRPIRAPQRRPQRLLQPRPQRRESAAAAQTPPTPPAEESKLEKVSPLPAAGQLPAGKWVAGTNYRPLMPAQPTDVPPGKVEVLEVFWYACPHCYALEPFLERWLQDTSRPTSSSAACRSRGRPVHQSHARLFYALEALGKESALHADIFDEMHESKNYMFAQGDDAETLAAQTNFVKAHGISDADFTNAYNSFTVQTNLSKADDLVHRYHIDGVPTIIVNGKYRHRREHGLRRPAEQQGLQRPRAPAQHDRRPGCQRKRPLGLAASAAPMLHRYVLQGSGLVSVSNAPLRQYVVDRSARADTRRGTCGRGPNAASMCRRARKCAKSNHPTGSTKRTAAST